jgi:hypothetical protein
MAASAELDRIQLVIAAAVDAGFYRAVYPDVVKLGMNPVIHYADLGWREGRDPTPWFSTERYLAMHPDVAAAGVNPLHHYLVMGRREGREIARSRLAREYYADALRRGETPAWNPMLADPPPRPKRTRTPAPPAPPTPDERVAAGKEFDADFYLRANTDVAEAGCDPLEHFLTTGWLEGRDPNAVFSIADYLDAYPDIAVARINPFVHYVMSGRAEGRSPRSNLGFRHDIIAGLVPIEERVADAARATAAFSPEDPARLKLAFAASRSGWRDLHVTFSHDDYSTNLGGVQITLQREAARIAGLGRDHLHLFPWKPWPTVREPGEPGLLGVVWNEEVVGVFAPAAVADAVGAAASAVAPGARSFAIHSLLGHSADETAGILEAAGLRAGYFWLHDFASLCAGFHLMRNDVADCGAPPLDSPACGICIYLPMRERHIAQHRRLAARLALTVVAPSETTLEFWRRSGGFKAAAEIVLPHARLKPRPGAAPAAAPGPFRFAFLGMPSSHKGWPAFKELALKYARDPRYAFVHLGARAEGGLPIAFQAVSVSEADPLAMRNAVEAQGVDAAMIWPLCRETFSFTAYEAAAGGAAIVTSPDSGNVAAFVQAGGGGLVFADEAALDAAFASGEILALGRAARRAQPCDLEFSGLTADLVASQKAVA